LERASRFFARLYAFLQQADVGRVRFRVSFRVRVRVRIRVRFRVRDRDKVRVKVTDRG
jgi:hypothetical protein